MFGRLRLDDALAVLTDATVENAHDAPLNVVNILHTHTHTHTLSDSHLSSSASSSVHHIAQRRKSSATLDISGRRACKKSMMQAMSKV